MMRALSASCAPGTTRNRLSLTALSMIWRKLPGIERPFDCGYGPGGQNPPAQSEAQFTRRSQPNNKRSKRGVSVIFVAVDIGGTFTDLIGFDDEAQAFVQAKSLTTPAELTQGVINCIRESGIDASGIDELIHGSTTALNTLIERKGAKTGLVVTRGTRDVYIIGRGNRPEAYNLFFHRHQPLVSRRHTLEVAERVLASGDVHEPLKARSVADACKALKA